MKLINARDINEGSLVFVDNPKYHPKLKGVVLQVTGKHERESIKRGIWTHAISLKRIDAKENEYSETYSQFIEFLKPIKLNKQKLLDCGFEVDGVLDDLVMNLGDGRVLTFNLDNRRVSIYHRDNYIQGFNIKKVEYLHKLQNLIYELTDKELEVKIG